MKTLEINIVNFLLLNFQIILFIVKNAVQISRIKKYVFKTTKSLSIYKNTHYKFLVFILWKKLIVYLGILIISTYYTHKTHANATIFGPYR